MYMYEKHHQEEKPAVQKHMDWFDDLIADFKLQCENTQGGEFFEDFFGLGAICYTG